MGDQRPTTYAPRLVRKLPLDRIAAARTRLGLLTLAVGVAAVVFHHLPFLGPEGQAFSYLGIEIAAVAVVFGKVALLRLPSALGWALFGAAIRGQCDYFLVKLIDKVALLDELCRLGLIDNLVPQAERRR